MHTREYTRELAICALFGAAALLLPTIFHLVHLGHVFMPMYLPLIAMAFFVRPAPAAATACVTPLLSGALTGMPPFYPPLALVMSIELSTMCALIAWVRRLRPGLNAWLVLLPVLLLGRVLNFVLVYLASLCIDLPAAFLATVSLLSGWPGLLLILAIVPPLVRAAESKNAPLDPGGCP